MELEQEPRYITLTKRQREKVKKRSLYRYHNLGERVYTPEEMEELYEGVSVPKEIIMEEIARVKPELKLPKERKEKNYSEGGLESQIVKRDLKKVGTFGKKALKMIAYSTIGLQFALPTMIRKVIKAGDDDHFADLIWPLGLFAYEGIGLYLPLAMKNPKLALTIGLAAVGTNIASGIYEYVRHLKERTNQTLQGIKKSSSND